MRWPGLFLAAILALGAAPCASFADTPASSPGHVPEPEGLYKGAMHGYVPTTLKGGTVLDTARLAALLDKEHPLLVDVAERDRKPPSMAKDMPWLPRHSSIPGAVWLQGAGTGTDSKAFEAAYGARMASLTRGDPARLVVVFCHPDCWGSYNAAKRLVGLGYTHVYWYPEGMEGWQSDHETAVIKPDATWVASLPQDLTR